VTTLLSHIFSKDNARRRNERVWCKLLEKPPMQALVAKSLCWLFSIPQRCTRRRTPTVARMKISCRGRAFLSADLSVHLPDKRARALYVYYAKDVNKQTDRQAARRQSFRIKRAASANELRRAQKAVVSSAQRIREKSQLRKEQAAVSKFLAPHDKSGWSICFEYISYSIFRLSLHTIHSNEQKMIGCCHVCSIFVVFPCSVCILAGSFRGPCKEKYQ
jgi:hypothetical protein